MMITDYSRAGILKVMSDRRKSGHAITLYDIGKMIDSGLFSDGESEEVVAANIPIVDTGELYAAENVEAALAEVKTQAGNTASTLTVVQTTINTKLAHDTTSLLVTLDDSEPSGLLQKSTLAGVAFTGVSKVTDGVYDVSLSWTGGDLFGEPASFYAVANSVDDDHQPYILRFTDGNTLRIVVLAKNGAASTITQSNVCVFITHNIPTA